MHSLLDDPFGYKTLPSYQQAVNTMPAVDVPARTVERWWERLNWPKMVQALGMLFGVLFVCQLAIARSSDDLSGYRARALDNSHLAGIALALCAGGIWWGRSSD